MSADRDNYPLRRPCVCGSETGHIVVKGGQNCVYCNGCDRYAGFNAPKSETGEATRSVRSREARRPSDRARVLLRDGYRCVLCGRTQADGINIQEGHIVSLDAGRRIGLTEDELNDDENLAAMCEECNLGLGKQPLPLRTAIAILRARISWRDAKEAS